MSLYTYCIVIVKHLLREWILYNVYRVLITNRLAEVKMGIFIGENDQVILFYKRLQHLCLKICA